MTTANNYIHYYLLTIIGSILIWGMFEYITICNGMACMIETSRLWKGLIVISSIFIPITLVLFPYILKSLKEFPKTVREILQDLQNPQIAPFGLILKLAIVFMCVCMFILFFYYAGLNSIAISEKSVAATQANMFVVAATLFAPLAALIFVQDWKAQHNKNISSEIARKIWKNLDKVKVMVSQINHRYENMYDLSDNDFENLNLFFKEKINEINDTMLESYLDLRLLDESILDNNLVKEFEDHIFIEINLNNKAPSLHKELMSLYTEEFLPREKNLKKELKLLIKA